MGLVTRTAITRGQQTNDLVENGLAICLSVNIFCGPRSFLMLCCDPAVDHTGGTISFIMKNMLIANELIALLGGPKLIAGAS